MPTMIQMVKVGNTDNFAAAASGDQDWKLAGKSGQSSRLFLVFRLLLLPTGPFSKHFHLESLNISFFHKPN